VRLARLLAGLLVAAGALLAGCTILYAVGGEAACTGVDPARIRDAVGTDPELTIVRTFPARSGVDFWCDRSGDAMHVSMSTAESVVRIVVSSAERPTAEERTRWIEDRDYVCARLTDACPGIGAWELWDRTEGGFDWVFRICCLLVIAIPAAGLWLFMWSRRPKRPANAT
jgi:hypothetical protein